MKFYYPSPLIFAESDPTEMLKYSHSVGMIAINPNKDFVMVRELYYPSIWNSFYSQVKTTDLDKICIVKDPNEEIMSVSLVGDEIIKGMKYIISKGYVFLGLLYFDSEVFDNQIIEERGWLKKKNKNFKDILSKYQKKGRSPHFNKQCIETRIIGRGENFFKLKKQSFQQIAQSTTRFKGSLAGIAGIHEKSFQFTILSQNITLEKEISDLIFDKVGKDTLQLLVKTKEFYPALGFRFDYGIHSFKLFSKELWGSIELIPHYSKYIKKFLSYLTSLVQNKKSPFKLSNIETPFDIDQLEEKIEEKHLLSAEKLLKKVSPPAISLKKVKIPTQGILEKQESKQKLPQKITLKQPTLPKASLKKIEPISKIESSEEAEYEDVFNISSEKIFGNNDEMIVNGKMGSNLIKTATSLLEGDFGAQIDPLLMSKENVFKDLENSLVALSELDRLAQENEAISRIFYPPRALFSYSSKEGMEIGGCTALISMGVGREITMVPEFSKDRTWAEFDSEIEGNPQIKSLEPKDGTFIENAEELEQILHQGFINLKRNNQIFLGLCEIYGNGFEKNSFDPELNMDTENLRKLNSIYLDRIKKIKYPPLSEEKWIEIHYLGRSETINFLTNPDSMGVLDIAYEVSNDDRFLKGIFSGIICVDEEAIYLFILTDNLSDLLAKSPNYKIDQETLGKMYKLIETAGLTPVSWCKFSFGFESFKNLILWDDIKDEAIVNIIKDNYNSYIQKLVQTKKQEDGIREKIESNFPEN